MSAALFALEDVCQITMGQAPPGDSYNANGIGWPLMAGAGDFASGNPSPKKFTTTKTRLSASGDVIVGIRATIGTKVLSDKEYCLGRSVAGLRPKHEVLQDRYLWHWLSSIENELSAKGRGATFKQVNRSDIAELQIPVPPLEEQRRIAAVLDKADELRAKRRAAVALLDTLTESIFLDIHNAGDASQWPMRSIESLAKEVPGAIRTGPFGSQLLHSEFVNEGVAVLGIDNAVQDRFTWGKPRFVTVKKYEQLRRFTVSAGDVLVTIMGTCGRSAVVPNDIPVAINTKHLCCITLNHALCFPSYLAANFRYNPDLRQQLGARQRGAVMPGLNMGLIKGATLRVPPIDLQLRFDERRLAAEALSEIHQQSDSDLDELFAALQQRAFRGDL